MAMKRKFDDAGDVANKDAKQLKLAVPFPNCAELDSDVAMTDAEPLYSQFHVRASSNASSTDSDTSEEDSPCYPAFDLYPHSFFGASDSMDTNDAHSASVPVGLIQPSKGFAHHGSNCSQIPKLRVACSPGVSGQRTMWSFCEQCGAISMVESE